MKDTMDLVASLDIGSDKMVMALGERGEGYCRLIGTESVASEGVVRGYIEDRLKVKSCILRLLKKFRDIHEVDIDSLNIALPSYLLRVEEKKEGCRFSRSQVMEEWNLMMLERRCRNMEVPVNEEVVDVFPVGFEMDGKNCTYPVGNSAKQLDAFYQVYIAQKKVLNDIREILAEVGIQEVTFFAVPRIFYKALSKGNGIREDIVVVDLGAEHIQVTVLIDGLLVTDVDLALGCNSIDRDIDTAFKIQDEGKARMLKEEYGMALRVECKNQKIMIPGTRYSIECHDLAYVEQCRLEELLEGAIFQIQQSGYYEELENGILLTGGGCRVHGIDILLNRLSGLPVQVAQVRNMHALKHSNLEHPEYLTALGLLMCELPPEEKPNKWKDRLGGWFRN